MNLNNTQTLAFSSSSILPSFSIPATTTTTTTTTPVVSIIPNQTSSYSATSSTKDYNHHNYSSKFTNQNKQSTLHASNSEPNIISTPTGNSLQCPICLENFDEVMKLFKILIFTHKCHIY